MDEQAPRISPAAMAVDNSWFRGVNTEMRLPIRANTGLGKEDDVIPFLVADRVSYSSCDYPDDADVLQVGALQLEMPLELHIEPSRVAKRRVS
ncbi:hypothetical protein [Mycobacterium intracellulare]|uniref:hypothetical protein n=1 Tax=Mycobacterium intracellulare TaxID=1767 RepID=UPI001140EC79|nr:hypothetical protein [Mycobacterium intracellulare]